MTDITYNPNSLYANTPQLNQYLEYLGFWKGDFVNSNSNDVTMTLEAKYDKRPDLLSQDLYNTTSWWWIFMLYNPDKIQDPIYDFVAGKTIIVPNKQNLPKTYGG